VTVFRNNEKGLSLIEILASIVIIGIILTTFFGFFSQSMMFSKKSEDILNGVEIARKELVNFQKMSTSSITTNSPTFFSPSTQYPTYSIIYGNSTYEIKVTNLSTTSSPKYNLFAIQVQVYSEGKLVSHTFGYYKKG
jgi:prepilin-type N-terminal cleavage/methylation domain-containing protein